MYSKSKPESTRAKLNKSLALESDARLIAAAPKMLTALEYLVNDWIEDHEDATADLHDDTCGYCYAQKVIAQARGEEK